MQRPFEAAVVDGRLYGRGSYDMKGSVAAGLGAAEALRSSGTELKGDLVIASVADEEHASLGTSEVLEQFVTDGAIVTEPTDLAICLAHKGFVWVEVLTRGRAAHGSQHQVGIDANMHMGRVLCRLEALNCELGRLDHPLVGSPSLHAALLEGGSGLSTYAAGCSLQIERRTIPGETLEDVEQQIGSLLAELSARDPAFTAEQRTVLAREPFEVAPDSDIVKALEQACMGLFTKKPVYRGENPWMDSALLAEAGIETVVIGPRGAGAHADEEWVDLQSVTQLAAILARTAQLYCGVTGTHWNQG
jgi:acetylornithine deacetylase